MPTLTCPNCGTTLTVSDAAPARLTCPRCMGHLQNPNAHDPRQPIPVLPLEHETEVDVAGSRWATAVMALLLITGAFGLFLAGHPAPGLLVIAVVFVFIMAIITGAPRRRSAVLGDTSAGQLDAAHKVLAYRSPPTVVDSPPDNLRTTGLFLIGLVIGPVGTMAAGAFYPPLALGVPLGGIILACVPGYRALGAGMLVGLGVAFLILLSICGAMLKGL